MKADEMFEKLGYKKKETDLEQIQYKNELNNIICFDLTYHTVAVFNYYDGFEYITMQELQAINEKVKELGWNEL
jgi:hypothetical protein